MGLVFNPLLSIGFDKSSSGGGGSGGVDTIVPVGNSPNANGGTISGTILTLQPADGTHPGVLTATVQTIAGNKTFTGTLSASNLSGTNTGDVSLGTSNGLSVVGQILSLQLASTSTTGALSSTDWNTFNISASRVEIVEYHTISSGEAAAKQFNLSFTPVTANKVLVDIPSGTSQIFGVDFNIITNVFNWSGFNLDGILTSGDVIRFHYIK